MSAVKDICTLTDGHTACMAGIAALIAFVIGIVAIFYVFIWIQPDSVKEVCELLQSFALYYGSIITTGSAGKLLTNRAEGQGEKCNEQPGSI